MFAYIAEWLSSLNIPRLNFPSVGLTDLVDIALVAVILYYILRWIRQTRAWSLFKGIVIVLLITACASVMNLVTVLWIVQNAFAMGLIVMVILFQPELRKALEQLGKGILFSPFSKSGEDYGNVSAQTASEVVQASRKMSDARMGALIVMEQDVGLAEFERTGIPIDATVSSQLLINIFENKTPLHDGAVIIRSNRIAAATCILPLTAEEIGRDLGTRHRAAVGISEISDALVVVVSEETGIISIAMGGRLIRNLNEYQMREMLLKGDGGNKRRTLFWRSRDEKKTD